MCALWSCAHCEHVSIILARAVYQEARLFRGCSGQAAMLNIRVYIRIFLLTFCLCKMSQFIGQIFIVNVFTFILKILMYMS